MLDDELSQWYDFAIDIQDRAGRQCYVFAVKAKSKADGGDPDKVVIDYMTTWFDYKTYQVIARNYSLSYSAGVYAFNVDMEVEINPYKDLMVPTVIRYNGSWNVFLKGREQGVFTATLFDFGN
jgi:hypothetical protein